MDVNDPAAERMLDGNAVAGALSAVFGGDVTLTPGCCAHCGAVNMVGAMRAWVGGPGSVLRCPACDGVVLRVVTTPRGTLIDVRGAAYLRFERG